MRSSTARIAFWFLVCSAMAACHEADPVVPVSDSGECAPELESLDFGIVILGQAAERTFSITNPGAGTASGEVLVDGSAPCDGFTVVAGKGPFSLLPGQSHEVTVSLEPASTGDKTCRLDLGGLTCGSVMLAGRCEVAPQCVVEPTNIDLGTVPLGTVRDESFTITNTGGGFLTGSVAEACPEVSILSGGGSYRLGAGESHRVDFRFEPSAGAVSCTITTGSASCANVTVTGVSEFPTFAATAVGHRGTILRSVDGGETWAPRSSGTTLVLAGISFGDATTGTVVGQSGTILRTEDGGDTWTPQSSGVSSFLASVHFVDADVGTVVGQNGVILRTIDGGSQWTRQTSNTTINLTAVHFADASSGCAVGWNGLVLWTNDGGVQWSMRTSDTELILDAVHLFDPVTAIIATGRNTPNELLTSQMMITTNQGGSWSVIEPAPEVNFNAMAFANRSSGVAVGAEGEVLWTDDGGVSWAEQQSGVTNLNGVALLNSRIGIAVGFGGTIVETLDGGDTWVLRTSGTSQLLTAVAVEAMP